MNKAYKIIAAPDSFKGSLSAVEAANAIESGLKKANDKFDVIKIPMADGGEGTVEAMVMAAGGEIVQCDVIGPLGDKVQGFYGIIGDGSTVVIEMAAASGITLVPENRRNPLYTTSYGTGELIKIAAARRPSKIIIGIGGSATNDGGMGMAQALGVKFFDRNGKLLGLGGKELLDIADICMDDMDQSLKGIDIQVACDVTNPLCGEYGASAVFGPQKGATPEMVKLLDKGLNNFADIIQKKLNKNILDIPGSGASGGLGAGLMAFLDARLMRGIEIVIDAVNMKEKIESASLVITGEGRTDSQTAFGKVPVGIAKIATEKKVPVICLSGSLGKGYEAVYELGITSAFSILDRPMLLSEAITGAAGLLEESSYSLGRLIAQFESFKL
jgi:glycerate kinase